MMERLTMKIGLCGMASTEFCFEQKDCYTCEHGRKCFKRLAAYEDTGLEPEEIMELVRAEKDGRLVVLPCKRGDELIRNGLTFKADHWNVLLTAFADDASTPSGKRVKLFYPGEAEAALERRKEEK